MHRIAAVIVYHLCPICLVDSLLLLISTHAELEDKYFKTLSITAYFSPFFSFFSPPSNGIFQQLTGEESYYFSLSGKIFLCSLKVYYMEQD